MYSFNHIFLSLELLLLGLIVISFFKHKVGIKQSVLIFAIALTCLVASAAIGILVVERCVSKAVQNTIWVIMTKPPPRFSAQRPGGSSLLFETLDELCRMGSAYEKPPR
jgi:hypothetical protein